MRAKCQLVVLGPTAPVFKNTRVHHFKAVRLERLKQPQWAESYDDLLLTSKSSILFLRQLPKVNRIICVGDETARCLRAKHRKLPSVIVLKRQNQEGILRYYRGVKGVRRVAYPRSTAADPKIRQGLRRAGHKVSDRCLYKPHLQSPKPLLERLLLRSEAVAVLLTSPSTGRALYRAYRKLPQKIQLYAIGPTTARAARALRWSVKESPVTQLEGMLRFVLKDCL
jgi:uroporphyrinogen-III synthase